MTHVLKSCQNGQISPGIVKTSRTACSASLSYQGWVWSIGYHDSSAAHGDWANKHAIEVRWAPAEERLGGSWHHQTLTPKLSLTLPESPPTVSYWRTWRSWLKTVIGSNTVQLAYKHEEWYHSSLSICTCLSSTILSLRNENLIRSSFPGSSHMTNYNRHIVLGQRGCGSLWALPRWHGSQWTRSPRVS